jgi:ATP-binding cassette subfamily F protein uup
LREQLDESKTIIDNISDGTDTLLINGQRKHIYTYLQDFLFTPDRARQLVKFLSGGERNRLLLAKLFTRNSNLLVLDEPTNDLDTETLELLEELLVSFEGTLIVVSHDRAFLNNVVTSTISLSGNGEVREYIGGYDDYIRQKSLDNVAKALEKKQVSTSSSTNVVSPGAPQVTTKAKKLSFKEQKEFEEIPKLIEQLEQEQSELQASMSDPDFFKSSNEAVAQDMKRIAQVGEKLQQHYTRWEELGG